MYFFKINDTESCNATVEQINVLDFYSLAIFFAFTGHIQFQHYVPEAKN
jgi:hypothetical protein